MYEILQAATGIYRATNQSAAELGAIGAGFRPAGKTSIDNGETGPISDTSRRALAHVDWPSQLMA